ncbi:MAG TPA: hydroxyphenylacetyl-CoA thioesterase PaaI [Gemmatimonadaceae bacterium]|nr:hydroxyphenylacetyl-CoA thioesterase PaaI [Gemmatimonadaceae bacterium]
MTASDAQRLAERVVDAMMARDAFSRWLGIEVLEVAPQRSACRLTVREEMVNGFGVTHGGIAFSLADSAFAFACNSHGKVTVSIENSITYPAPIGVGDVLTAIAKEDAASGRLSYYSAEVRNQRNEVVGLFRGTAFKTARDHAV